MALSIRNQRAETLARELAERRHVSMTQAIIDALEQHKAGLEHESATSTGSDSGEEKARLVHILEIGRRCAQLDDRDTRSVDEILGYGDHGVPL